MKLVGRLFLLSALALALAACSLAGDITPPPGFSPTAIPPQSAQPTSEASLPPIDPNAGPPTPVNISGPFIPPERPSAAAGAVVYAAHCEACHGPAGNGGGKMTPQLTVPIPNFSTPELARQTTPGDWYKVVTAGRLDRFMPPWINKLSEAERWSAVYYIYDLSTSQEQIDTGRQIYTAQCAECHGETGQGDGLKAASLSKAPRDFTDLAGMAALSQVEMFKQVSDGGDPMPAFGAKLSEAERWAVLDYVRSFSYDYFAPGSPLPEQIGAVEGQVTNGTAGSSRPAGLEVRLHRFDSQGAADTFTATAAADGSFRFSHIGYRSDNQFILSTTYSDTTYTSEVVSFPTDSDTLSLPVTVYEMTTGPDSLRVDRLHMFIEFTGPQEVTVGELFILSNVGDRTINAGPDLPAIEIPLPAEAANLAMDGETEGQGYMRTPAGMSLLRPIVPGAQQILISYVLSYPQKLTFTQDMAFPVEQVNLMVADAEVELSGPGLQNQGVQSMQGISFQSFSGGPYVSGAKLEFDLSGQAGVAAAASPSGSAGAPDGTNSATLALGLGALALVLIGIGVWWWRRGVPAAVAAADDITADDLLEAIAELDEEHEAGQIDEPAYRRERAALKADLQKKWRS